MSPSKLVFKCFVVYTLQAVFMPLHTLILPLYMQDLVKNFHALPVNLFVEDTEECSILKSYC